MRYLYTLVLSPWAFCVPGWTVLPLLTSPHTELLHILNHLYGPFLVWLWYNSVSHLLGSTALDPASQIFLSSAKQSGRITSHYLLATLCLVQPRMLLTFFATVVHCWIMDNLGSTKMPRYFIENLLSRQSVQLPLCTGTENYSSPGVGLFLPLCWTLWDFCWPISSTCQGLSERQNNHLACKLLFPILYCL